MSEASHLASLSLMCRLLPTHPSPQLKDGNGDGGDSGKSQELVQKQWLGISCGQDQAVARIWPEARRSQELCAKAVARNRLWQGQGCGQDMARSEAEMMTMKLGPNRLSF